MFSLTESMRELNQIPVTFDAELPAFASGQSTDRLLIGQSYCITTPQGDVTGRLQQAIANPEQKSAFCCLRGDDGRDRFVTVPLTDPEVQAYRESPRTFFGQEEPEKQVRNPLKLYDWMLSSYKETPKPRLLELFAEAGAKDLRELTALPQEKLAEIFAERMTESALSLRRTR